MEDIKIESYELSDNDLFYCGYVYGLYFEDTIDSSMQLFDHIATKLKSQPDYITEIIESLLYTDYISYGN